MGCARARRAAKARPWSRLLRSRRTATVFRSPPAASHPASAPSTRAAGAPAMPVISPAAYTSGQVVRWSPSTSTNSPAGVARSAHPAASGSSSCGLNPCETHTASTATVRSLPCTTDQSARSRAVTTSSTHPSPRASMTVRPVRYGTRCRANRALYSASSAAFPACAASSQGRRPHPRARVAGVLASSTSRTRDPASISDAATGSRNGPLPATTTWSPTTTRSPSPAPAPRPR